MTYWRSLLLVFFGACSYGVLSIFVKLAYADGFGVGAVTGSQMLFGTLILLPMVLITRTWEHLSRRQWIQLGLAGSLVGLTSIFYYTALLYIPASIAIIFLFQFTWMGILFEAVLQRKKPGTNKILSIVLLLFGTFLAGNVGQEGTLSLSLLGVVCGVLAACSYAGFIISSGRVAVEVNPWMRSLVMSVGSLVVTFVVFPPVFLGDQSLLEGLWFWGFMLALFGIAIPNVFFATGVPQIGVGTSTIIGSAELPTAVLFSWLLLGEYVSLLQWTGVLVILVAIGIAEIQVKRFGSH
jgi:drug/metabolite transporter (DMT)-like permease